VKKSQFDKKELEEKTEADAAYTDTVRSRDEVDAAENTPSMFDSASGERYGWCSRGSAWSLFAGLSAGQPEQAASGGGEQPTKPTKSAAKVALSSVPEVPSIPSEPETTDTSTGTGPQASGEAGGPATASTASGSCAATGPSSGPAPSTG